MSEKILIIDDEQDIADLLEVYLKNENYVVYKFYCATDAMSCIESGDIDLAILDIMLPDMNGFSLCQLIRKKYTYPIIMLTAKIEETDKITGLTLGADDYVTKPFRPLEVVARVKAQLRRYKKYSPGIITEKRSQRYCFFVSPVFIRILLYSKIFPGSRAGKVWQFSDRICLDDAGICSDSHYRQIYDFPGS